MLNYLLQNMQTQFIIPLIILSNTVNTQVTGILTKWDQIGPLSSISSVNSADGTQEWNMSVYVKLEKHTPSREVFFHILLLVVLVHNNYWFVPHRQLCFLLQMVIYCAFLPPFFYLFCGRFCNSASYVIFNKTFTPNKPLGCYCIHNQRIISLLCFTSLQAQMSGQH